MSRRNVDPILRQVVDRCHVATSNLAVARYVISRLKHGRKTWISLPKRTRKKMLRDMFAVHRENRKLYQSVMFPSYR